MVIHTKDHAEAYPETYLVNDANIQRRSARQGAVDAQFMATPISHV